MFKDGLKPPISLYFFILLRISFLGGGRQDERRWSTRFPSILSWAEVMVGQWPLASQDLEFFIISDFQTKKSALPFFLGGFPSTGFHNTELNMHCFLGIWGSTLVGWGGWFPGPLGSRINQLDELVKLGKFLRFYHDFLVWIIWEMANNLVDILKHIPILCTLLKGASFTSEWWCILTVSNEKTLTYPLWASHLHTWNMA